MKTPQTTCFFTGHRYISKEKKEELNQKIPQLCIDLIENKGVTDFICGGALGFDTLAEIIILTLKKIYPSVRLHLYLPCTNQTERWNENDKKIWQNILSLADSHTFITNAVYCTGCMQKRNRQMVRDADYGIAYCNREKSGSAKTLQYARELNKTLFVFT